MMASADFDDKQDDGAGKIMTMLRCVGADD